jgi:site-specific recombinase XerD
MIPANKSAVPSFRSLKFADWPDLDRHLFNEARIPGTLFKPGGLASGWRHETLETVIHRYGTFLWWLRETGRLKTNTAASARVNAECIERFVEAYAAGHSSVSLLGVIHGVHEAVRVMHPGAELSDLAGVVKRVKAVARPRPKLPRMADHEPLLDLGEALIEEGAKRVHESHMLSSAKVRDGCLILFLCVSPIRRANLAGLRLGKTIVRGDEGYHVSFSAEEMKTGIPFEVELPHFLTRTLDFYVDVARPVLLARSTRIDEGWLWLGAEGLPMTPKSLSRRVREITDRHLQRPMSAHLFRDAAATAIALRDGAHVGIVAGVLGHARQETSEKHYNQARSFDACRRYQQLIESKNP